MGGSIAIQLELDHRLIEPLWQTFGSKQSAALLQNLILR